MEKRELVIIGAGPAGLSAAIYGKRAGLDTLVLEKGRPGGQVLITSKIENYPGILDGTGSGLADAFRTHAEHFKAEFRTASVQKLEVRDGEKIITLKDGSEIADLPVGEEGYSSPFPFCSDGPRIDEFLAEMRREVFEGREGYMNVGEAPGITPARNEHVTDPANKELDMLFLFDHVGIDQEGSKWNTVPFEVKNLRDRMTEQQEAVRKAGWASLFFCNHDQPRVVSRWGNDSDRDSRELSAKAFGMVLHMHRGTPYIYEGEELGMTNAHFTKLEQYRDLEALNGYRQRVEEAKCQSSESMMAALALIGRDNARTPMQWDASKYAGFTAPDAPVEPWISVNPNHVEINAAEEFDDPDSVYTFYKKLIAMRHNSATISTGEWHLLAADSDQVYAFTRTNGDDTILVVVNLTDRSAALPSDVAELLSDGVSDPQVLLSTYDAMHSVKSIARGELARWEGVVIQL